MFARAPRPAARRRRLAAFIAVVVGLLAFGSGARAADAARKHFNVPTGDAEQTLKIFSEQATVNLLFPTELVAGVRTRAVTGQHTASRALALMLEGTELTARHDARTGVVTVRRLARPAPPRKVFQKKDDAGTAADEMIELSPFTVRSARDPGYLAANSLSGSRMDIRLKDTAASISVLTEEFVQDVGAFDLSEVLVFGNNTALDLGEFGDFGSSQEGNARIEFEQRYRVRGLPATVARNYFKWTVPTDIYNVGRVEESRGPNSILFGIGSAGGIINFATKQALMGRRIRTFHLATGSHDSRRAAVDFNQPLSNAVMAVRFNAVWDRSNSFRHHAFSENRRAHLAGKYRPNASTEFRLEVEHGTVKANVPRTGALYDRSLPWINAGRPIFAASADAAEFAHFGTRLGPLQLRYISDLDRLLNLEGQILTTAPGPAAEITDPRHVDPSINTGGPGQVRANDFATWSAHFERQIARRSFVVLVFNHQRYRYSSFDPISSNLFFGDPNQALPGEPGPNPFAGASLLETNWRLFERREASNALRGSVSVEFDAGRRGLYRAAALGEYQESRYRNRNAFETWEAAPFNVTPESNANRVTRRSYVTLHDWASYHVNGPATTGLIRNMREPLTGRTLSSTWMPSTGVNDDRTAQGGVLLGLQAAYLGGRLVAGAGYRHDRLRIKDRGIVRNPQSQIFEVDYARATFIEASGRTMTLGVVGHVSPHVSLLYNQSRNIDIPDANLRVLPDAGVGPPPKGRGEDYGFALDLHDGRIHARAVRFTTEYNGEIGFGGNPIFNVNNNILAALRAAGLVSQAEFDARDLTGINGRTRDKRTAGYEFSLTANPTVSWRWQANWSITDGRESNIVPEVVAWWAEARRYFARFPQEVQTGVGVNTIATTLENFQSTLDNWRSAEGIGLVGNRRHRANFFARYTFSAERIKGLYVGGGYRYAGRMLAGRTEAGVLQFAPGYGEGAFVVGRTLRPRKEHELRIQLNVSNLFDETDAIIVRYGSSGNTTQTQQVILRAPRTWRLSAEFSF